MTHRKLRSPREQHHCTEPAKKTAKPRESKPREEHTSGIRDQFRRRFEHVVKLCSDDSGKAGNQDHGERVERNVGKQGRAGDHAATVKIGLEDIRRCDQGESDHQSKGGNGQGAKVQVRNHENSK